MHIKYLEINTRASHYSTVQELNQGSIVQCDTKRLHCEKSVFAVSWEKGWYLKFCTREKKMAVFHLIDTYHFMF